MSATLYEPTNVYKPVTANIAIVDGPFEYFTVGGIRMPMPFTTRMTVIRLTSGEVFLHSPIAFDEALAAELQTMRSVRHLISPNQWHYAHIEEWQRAFLEAVMWASPGVRQRARARHIEVHFDRDLEPFPAEEWRAENDQTLVADGIVRKVAARQGSTACAARFPLTYGAPALRLRVGTDYEVRGTGSASYFGAFMLIPGGQIQNRWTEY